MSEDAPPLSPALEEAARALTANGREEEDARAATALGQDPEAQAVLASLASREAALAACLAPAIVAWHRLTRCFRDGGKLLLCGNGGSFADCLHISGELLKSFTRPRPLAPEMTAALRDHPLGGELAGGLERGLPAVVLGLNPSLASATLNDKKDGRLVLAQECLALGTEGDVLLGISTSGNAENVRLALAVAKALGMVTIALTGSPGGAMAPEADIALTVPGEDTARIQEFHQRLYHALCEAVEATLFPLYPC